MSNILRRKLSGVLLACGLWVSRVPVQYAKPFLPRELPAQAEQDQSEVARPGEEGTERADSGTRFRLGTASIETTSGAGLIDTAGLRPVPKDATPSSPEPLKRVEFVGAPIPVINPAIGNGLAVVGAVTVYLNPHDRKSPPSIFGGGLLFTSNGTRAGGAMAELFLKGDRFRITGLIGKGRINYDYHLSDPVSEELGLFVPLSLDAVAFMVEPKIRLTGRWYVGPRYLKMKSNVALDLSGWSEMPDLPEIDLAEVKAAALGIRVQHDTRDSQFYPRKGALFDFKTDFFRPSFGSRGRSYDHIQVSYQGYRGFGQKNVFAYRAAACSASTVTPFYALCMLGDIRGYAMGRYQDHRMLSGQAEYRRELLWRLGATGFMGAGQVAPKFSDFGFSKIRPGGGVGLRLLMAKQSHINLRADYAWGRGSTALYISIGEAF